MHGTATRVLVVATSLLVSASAALAQNTTTESGRAFKFGGMLGATLPTGDFGDIAGTGYHLGALGEYGRPAWPFAIRGEITWHSAGIDDYDGDVTVLSFVPNIVFPFGDAASTARPYIIGGLGIHNVDISVDVPGEGDQGDSEPKFGFNVGGGFTFKLAGFDTFAEVRYHSVFTSGSNTTFIPLSFGFKF